MLEHDENWVGKKEILVVLAHPDDPEFFLGGSIARWIDAGHIVRYLLVKFHELVRIMVDADLELAGLEAPGEGRKIIEEKFSGWHRWEDQVVSMGR